MVANNMFPTEEHYEIIRRYGPTVVDYLQHFRRFLYQRTGYRFENFRTPRHLQRLLDELSFNRVPITVWQGLLDAVLHIAGMCRSMEQKARHFGAFFIDVLCWLFKRLSRMQLLKVGIFLMAYYVHPLATIAISMIYYAIEYFLLLLWDELSKFLQSRLISAPYYSFLAAA